MAVPGLTPMFPVSVLVPVLVRVEPARAAKRCADPSDRGSLRPSRGSCRGDTQLTPLLPPGYNPLRHLSGHLPLPHATVFVHEADARLSPLAQSWDAWCATVAGWRILAEQPMLYSVDLKGCGAMSALDLRGRHRDLRRCLAGGRGDGGATLSHNFPGAGLTCILILAESHAVLRT